MARAGEFGRLRQLSRKYRLLYRLQAALRFPGQVLRVAGHRAGQGSVAAIAAAGRARPGRMLGLMRLARPVLPARLAVAQFDALLTARSAGWEAAAPLFRRIAANPPAGGPAAPLLAPPAPHAALRLIAPAARREVTLAPEQAARIVIYTACIGARPALPPLAGIPAGVRCLCFTDQPVTAPGWEIVAPAGQDETFHRLHPQRVLAGVADAAEYSLYMAPDRLCMGNLHTLFTRWLWGRDFALWRHDAGNGWPALAEHALVTGAAPAEAVLAQARACADEGVPPKGDAFDSGVIWRRHGNPGIAAMMERWWALQEATPGAADLALCRLLHGDGAAPAPEVMPAATGTASDTIFFARQPPPPPSGPGRHAGRRLPVVFLYPTGREEAANTVLRGQQLSEMIAARHGDIYDVGFTDDVQSVRDAVVILIKWTVHDYSRERIMDLKRRNIAVIGAWEDGQPDPAKAVLFDAHMTLSLSQLVELRRAFAQVPAYHVTHHVNTQIPPMTPPGERLHTGYFGELFNTVLPESLGACVDLVGINTMRRDEQWFHALPRFNCHWIVRNMNPWDGAKPFLKGFVAARCGAPVIVTRDDVNAAHYLGDDYPFYAESVEAAELEMAWARVAGAFGGADWRTACDIMAQVAERSSDDQVCAEFRAMIDAVAGRDRRVTR